MGIHTERCMLTQHETLHGTPSINASSQLTFGRFPAESSSTFPWSTLCASHTRKMPRKNAVAQHETDRPERTKHYPFVGSTCPAVSCLAVAQKRPVPERIAPHCRNWRCKRTATVRVCVHETCHTRMTASFHDLLNLWLQRPLLRSQGRWNHRVPAT